MAKAVRKNIPEKVKLFLWAKSAGRCNICNKNIYEDYQTFDEVNVADHAHIIGNSQDGPRGDQELSAELATEDSNIMLLCKEDHKLIDTEEYREKYSVELLRQIKQQHEDRVEFVTSIGDANKSNVLLYGANIAKQTTPVNFKDAARAMFPKGYPAERYPIAIHLTGSALTDEIERYWENERENLNHQFLSQVKGRLDRGDIQQLSVFALAPIPLLIELGALLTDKTRVEVYQLHREPPGWAWQNEIDGSDFHYLVQPPLDTNKDNIALVLSFSGRINEQDVVEVIGKETAIWNMTIEEPANDFLKFQSQLSAFRIHFRKLLDEIKHLHGKDAIINLFPAIPVSIAIEIGRVWMPKADLPIIIYDRNREKLNFSPAIRLG